ncbi:MAG: glycosyltransferase family 4 protein [Actinobacteria bacterium]|nr:glycosyltransferase family 4 protein [Actinomycetota bacterium]
MRIGMVCPYSLTIPGGVQGQALGLARTLRLMGHDVRVLGPCDGPPPDAGVTPLGNSLPTASNGSIAPIAPDVPAQLRTIRALRDEEFDVVHLHEPLCPGPTQTALLFKPARLVGTFHAAGESLPYRWVKPLVVAGANRLDVRCAVSEDAMRTATANLGGEYELLFNGVEVARYTKATPWPNDGDVPTILFVGRHEPRKGLAVLLDAMAFLPERVRLWVGGDGPQTDELRQRVAGDRRVQWLGRISDAEKAARLRAADAFCAPSLGGESFGVVLLEAMAAQTAVVASDLPGYANVARADRDALLVRPDDPQALAGALSRVLGEAKLRDRLVLAGERRAAEFSMDHLAERYIELYERVR